MSRSFDPFQLNEPGSLSPARSPVSAIYTHPDDVLTDPELTSAGKRAVLASWISDARAVENAPALRRLDSGAVVDVDAIRRALASLDGLETDQTASERPPFSRRRSSVISSWASPARPQKSANETNAAGAGRALSRPKARRS